MMDLRKRQITNQAEKNEDMFEINSNITNSEGSSEAMSFIELCHSFFPSSSEHIHSC